MHGWETRIRLKYYLEQGVSKAELSRRFGIARRTIHCWIGTGQPGRDLTAGVGQQRRGVVVASPVAGQRLEKVPAPVHQVFGQQHIGHRRHGQELSVGSAAMRTTAQAPISRSMVRRRIMWVSARSSGHVCHAALRCPPGT